MNKTVSVLCSTLLSVFIGATTQQPGDPDKQSDAVTGELDAYWSEVSRSVSAGDFAGYSATCHPEGVLVSGVKQTSYPLAQALAKWKQGFDDTRAQRMQASVEFRFS